MLVVLMTTVAVSAQESVAFRYGCISYDQALKSMPDYAKVEADLVALKSNYDKETKASEDEFNSKYAVFLNEYTNYAPSILKKRQSELEDLMSRNENFRMESIRLLEQARVDMMKPLKEKLDNVISTIANKYSLAFVLNTDSNAVPYMNMSMAYNITSAVEEALKE